MFQASARRALARGAAHSINTLFKQPRPALPLQTLNGSLSNSIHNGTVAPCLLQRRAVGSSFSAQMFFSTSAKPSLKDEAAGDVTEEPASIAHFTQSSTIHPLTGTPAAPVPNEMTATAGASSDPIWQNPVPHEVYNLDVIAHIGKTHHEPKLMYEKAALFAVKTVRSGFDLVSGYRGPGGRMTELDWLHRCLFLETVAGVPGMVAGMARHLRSLRSLKRDYGWIHTLLEEAENERMHLLIFMNMKQPGWMFRTMVLGAQGVFFNVFFVAYLVSPRTCHRFVGYLEEEAVKTYTGLLKDIEDGHLKEWQAKQAPLIARSYYNLPESATVFDMVKCVRADEANHRDVNHTFADLDQEKGVNPYMLKHKK